MSEEIKTKKVRVNWCETHYYEDEIEVPADLVSDEDLIDWVTSNRFEWGYGWIEPYEISTDWDSFEVDDVD
jgi:hypothetical protein